MATSSVNSSDPLLKYAQSASAAAKNTRNTGSLGKDDFLNLLVTQLQYQDPLNPMDDKEFIGQMAQFSSLEQMQNLNTSFTSTKAFSMIGKHVTATYQDSTTGESKHIEGTVSSVKMQNGKSYLVVNGQDVEVDKVSNVQDSSSLQGNISQYTHLLGYAANGYVYDSQSGSMIAVSGTVSSVAKGKYEDYAVMDGVETEITGVVSDKTYSDLDDIRKYLEKNLDTGNGSAQKITVQFYDRTNDVKVPATGVLKSYNIDDATGRITVKLDQVYVPVESITQIKSKG